MKTIAILKPIKVRSGNLAGLKGVINYIQASDKTQNGLLVFGKDCIPQKAAQQMIITKKAHNKDIGRQYTHFVQSFFRTDDLTPDQAFNIGKEFLIRCDKFKDYEVLIAVHTNEPQLHIHYIVNSVSILDGVKWQSTPKDLEKMRSISDDLCRENGLNVIENRGFGNRKYGEYTAKHSWKKQLATDIADSIKHSFSTNDFHNNLAERGIECDIGEKSILFEVKTGYCNLKNSRQCSNFKLMSYGDFSTENILQSIDYNQFAFKDSLSNPLILQDVMLTLGALHFPEEPKTYQAMWFGNVDFDGKSWLEIQEMLASARAKKDAQNHKIQLEQSQKQQNQNTQILLSSIAGLVDEFLKWKYESPQYNYYDNSTDENYYEEEYEWEL